MRAIRIHQTGGPEVLNVEEVDLPPAGQGRGPDSPSRDRRQFPRHLPSHRLLPDAPAAHPGRGGRGRGSSRSARASRTSSPAIGSPTPDRPAATPRSATSPRSFLVKLPRGDRRRHRRGDDAQGPHRAISPAPDLQGEGRRLDPRPCGGRRRRPDPLPMGPRARREGDRHGRVGRQGQNRQEGGRAVIRSSTARRISPSGSRTITKGQKCAVVYDGVGKATFPASLDCLKPFGDVRELRLGVRRHRGLRHRAARAAKGRCSRPGRPCSPSWPIGAARKDGARPLPGGRKRRREDPDRPQDAAR